jgi:Domain of unknown function (DUF4276)
MRYRALALFAEGNSDHPFLRRIIYRSVEDLGAQLSQQRLEVQERFVDGDKYSHERRAERVLEAFGKRIEQGAINLLFIHADGDSNPEVARTERVVPALNLIRQRYPVTNIGLVPVIPVRETEAWALADSDALKAEMGWHGELRRLTDVQLDDPEALRDPKDALKSIRLGAAGTAHRRHRRQREPIPVGLGDRIDLNRLRRLQAFRRFESELRAALNGMWGI